MSKIKKFIHALSDILVFHNIISESQAYDLEQLFARSSIEEFDEFIFYEGLATKDQVLEALSSYYQVPPFDVQGYFFDTSLLREFPKDFLLRNSVIPVKVDSDVLLMITDNPRKEGLEAKVRQFTAHDIEFHVGIRNHICNVIKEFYDRSYTDTSPIDS